MGIGCGKRSKGSTDPEDQGLPVSLTSADSIPLRNVEWQEHAEPQETLAPSECVEVEESVEQPERVESPKFPFSSPEEYYRLRIIAEHYYTKDNQSVLRFMDVYNKSISMKLYQRGRNVNFIQHFQVYERNMKKITDLTKIGMFSAQRPGETIAFRWDPNDEKWLLKSTYPYRMYDNKQIKKPRLWAIATHYKNHQEKTKEILLTEPFYFVPPIPYERIYLITYYNIHLEKIKEAALVKGEKHDKGRHYFAVWYLPNTNQEVFLDEDTD